ncbi:MAG: thiamine-phosphate synthase family protein [Candidatus Heimdallarchaeaceae archaeon]
MRFPCEFIASTFLPGLRVRIAHSLREKGKSQNEIARLLGVKQPVVVSYLQKKTVETGDEKINPYLDTLAETISSMLFSQESIEHIMKTICTKCKALRVNGPICVIHKSVFPIIGKIESCDICFGYDELPNLQERTKILRSLKRIFKNLADIPGIVYWIPEIGAQLAICNDSAKTIEDVASFPGRIIKIKNSVRTISEPEFGSSKTVSKLLLWMRKKNPNIQWILSIKNRASLEKILLSQNIHFFKTVEFDKDFENNLKKLSKAADASKIEALLDNASAGYESIAYLFTSSESRLLELVKIICSG